MDRLGSARQPDNVSESNYHDIFKTIVEVRNTSGSNFAVMCSTNINMAMKILRQQEKTSKSGSYQDGTYFSLTNYVWLLVDYVAEEICTFYLCIQIDYIPQANHNLKMD